MVFRRRSDTHLPDMLQQHMGQVHQLHVLRDTAEQLALLLLHVRLPEAGQWFQDVLLTVKTSRCMRMFHENGFIKLRHLHSRLFL